ncbi:hypothetical protein FA95DRAFT_144749 [Auriscalpium vulgare]|uniref:Uncharacterized protein n=1 Tax=Auriscalpium vulgare TaxID=40419 RepID=A0ACB8S6V3_9AGAM|nr:hypothetical protein FA95DRAFT_144749 [Auriscalpium vulgare]
MREATSLSSRPYVLCICRCGRAQSGTEYRRAGARRFSLIRTSAARSFYFSSPTACTEYLPRRQHRSLPASPVRRPACAAAHTSVARGGPGPVRRRARRRAPPTPSVVCCLSVSPNGRISPQCCQVSALPRCTDGLLSLGSSSSRITLHCVPIDPRQPSGAHYLYVKEGGRRAPTPCEAAAASSLPDVMGRRSGSK